MNVDGKVAIVTGASSGIGLATAGLLAERGARVVLVSRSSEKLKAIAEKLPGSIAIPADMSKSFEVRRMVSRARDERGRIDVLVNCAGQGYDALIEGTDIDTLRYIFEVDVIGPLVAMEEVIPIMRGQGGGAIVNVSSGTALMTLPNNGGYSGLKRALAAISLTAREELKGDGITVSVIYPYITLTDFEANTIKGPLAPEEHHGGLKPPDHPDHVAQKVLEAIEGGEAVIYAHDWMRPRER